MEKLDPEVLKQAKIQIFRELGKIGGKARAAKYDKKTLSRWAKKGGRPRKRVK